MSRSDREDLDGLPSIAPSSDDIETRRRSGRRGEGTPPPRAAGSGSLVFTNILIAFLIAGLTAAGWFIVAQNETLASVRSTLDSVENRLGRIEGQLQMTGDALSQTESETQSQLTYWESEIRKLWDVSNKRNRDWIQANQKDIADIKRDFAAQKSTLDQLSAQATQLTRGLAGQERMLEQLAQIDSRTADIQTRQRSLTDQVNTLNSRTAGMERRVRDGEEAVESMDAFRRDFIGRVTRLQERLDQMGNGSRPSQTITPQ